MSNETTVTIGGRVPVVDENTVTRTKDNFYVFGLYGDYRSIDNSENGLYLHHDGKWGSKVDYWPTREAAKQFVATHADAAPDAEKANDTLFVQAPTEVTRCALFAADVFSEEVDMMGEGEKVDLANKILQRWVDNTPKPDEVGKHCGWPRNDTQVTHCGCRLCAEIQSQLADKQVACETYSREMAKMADELVKSQNRVLFLEEANGMAPEMALAIIKDQKAKITTLKTKLAEVEKIAENLDCEKAQETAAVSMLQQRAAAAEARVAELEAKNETPRKHMHPDFAAEAKAE